MNQDIRKICLDLGNGNMKAAMVIETPVVDETGELVKGKDDKPGTEKRLVTAVLPSQVGVGNTNLGILDLGGFDKKPRKKKDDALPVAVRFDGGDYLVGHNVARYARLLERLDANKYTDSIELRALTYALLAQLLDGGSTDVAAIVALPVELTLAENAKETVKGIEDWLLGEHHFTYDGRVAHVTVHTMRVMAQPVGAFFAWGLDLDGQWARDESDLTDATVAVIDSGFNTLDLFGVRQGRIEKSFAGGKTLGVRRAAEEIARALLARFGFEPSLAECDAYIRAYLDKRPTLVIRNGDKHDLKPIIKQALGSLSTHTVGFIEEAWGKPDLSYVLLTGGGALVLDVALRKMFPNAHMLPDPVTANAAGLAKLAQRPGVFKGL